jgi:CBS domain-containing protein
LLGMITDRDIVVRAIAEGQDVNTCEARQVMSERLLYCFEDQDVQEAAELMSRHQVRRLPVIGRDKSLIGMISLGDISQSTDDEIADEALAQISKPTHHEAQPRH